MSVSASQRITRTSGAPYLWIPLALLLALGAMLGGSATGRADPNVFDDRQDWRDASEHHMKLSDLLGHGLIVMTMAYTNCQRTCPMTVRLLQDIERKLASQKRSASFTLFSLDSEHDTPERITAFLEAAAGTDGAWRFLRGSRQDTESMSKALAIDAYAMDDHIVHRFKVWIFDAHGHTVRTFDWSHRDVSDL